MKKIAIKLYMMMIQILGFVFGRFPVQQKVVMLISFPENPTAVLREMDKLHFTPETIVFYDPRMNVDGMSRNFMRSLPKTKANLIRLMFHLSTAKVVVTDNYFAELAGVKWRENMTCVQIWHANGALKKFGWEDKAAQKRSESDKKRFQAVYQTFSKVLVGSDEMGDIFKRSFLLDDARLLKLGVPRTDYYFDEATLALNKQIGLEKYGINGKKVLLYAPTFRDEALSETKLALDIAAMKQALGEEYKLLLKVHPSMVSDLEKIQDNFCVYADKETEIEALLPMTDVLITDYSSIPFEFSFFEKPMIFFAYDLEEYDGNRGLADHYLETIPGPLCKTTAEVIEAVQNPAVDLEQIRAFGAKWNKYSDGESSKRFVDFLQVELDRE
ncbi:CDP-glycerol glycerophosphotransferase family protein [Listeria weihenstephanensis]|uniref:CDP-glycerol glycerophosphotransferase family protein n=1 Tax=Listeria weihenstephanensis TaxID=1006155 RepID=A0A841Z9X1_9LIST|nr:CDP-glycerol glycerophosphotransferase family protein [Listeria weihenstephanensis]MBC1501964.1 CDP-glycerol glycerophosphotransferase family protein [Listeria weihenstephanensis]